MVGAASGERFAFDESPGRLEIRIDGKPFAVYVYDDPTITRPYFCNVRAPDGTQVTRRHPTDPVANKDNDDHPTYHPGIWLAFGDISGEDYWRNRARVRHVRFVEPPTATGDSARFVVENNYESASGIVCTEISTYTIHIVDTAYFLIADSLFQSETKDFVFGDQEEMGFGVRIATRFTVQHGNGTIRNSENGVNEAGTWGKPADWCTYFGEENGKRIGLTIVPNPANFRRSWFHSRDYGVLVANPFGEKAMTGAEEPSAVRVQAGETFRLGFGVCIFSEDASEPFDRASVYGQYQALIE
jgi:hypothetical protein